MGLKVEAKIQFCEYFTYFKTDFRCPVTENEKYLIILLASYITKYFRTCDKREFEPVKDYLTKLFQSDFKDAEQMNHLGITKNIFRIVEETFSDPEKSALWNLFGKAELMPYKSPGALAMDREFAFGMTPDPRPKSTYKINVFRSQNKISCNLHMPSVITPTKMFYPLGLAYSIEYSYLSSNTPKFFETSKTIMGHLLTKIQAQNIDENQLINETISEFGLIGAN